MIKKKICIILSILLVIFAVVCAFAGDGIIFNDLELPLSLNKENYASSVIICGVELKNGKYMDCNFIVYEDEEFLYDDFSEDEEEDLEEELVSNTNDLSDGPGGGDDPYSGSGLGIDYDEGFAYLKDGTLQLHDFQVGDGTLTSGINADTHDLDIYLEGENIINIATASEDGIICHDLTLSGEDGMLTIDIDANEEGKNCAGIRCNNFFLDSTGGSSRTLTVSSCAEGIVCNHFIMYQCVEDLVDIASVGTGLLCSNFTLYTENQCFVKVDAGDSSKSIQSDGIHASGAIYVESQESASDTIAIQSDSIGIISNSDIKITSGILNIAGSGTAAIKSEGTLTIDIEDHETTLPDRAIKIDIEGYDNGFMADTIIIDEAEVSLANIGDIGINADKIIINNGEITIDAGQTALYTSRDGNLYIGPFMNIDAGECEGEEEPVEEYGGEPFAHLFYCPHDRVVWVEGKEPTYFEDGWRGCYKCEDCKRYFEDEYCENVIKNYNKWKKGAGKLGRLIPPEHKSAIPVPANTGTPGNPVKLGEGTWTVDENGVWTFRTNAPFKNTWGCIELPPTVEGEPPKAGWFFFNDEGKMLTGWQLINGKWYYLSEEHDGTYGACQLGGVTKDGYILDENGAWTGERIAQ